MGPVGEIRFVPSWYPLVLPLFFFSFPSAELAPPFMTVCAAVESESSVKLAILYGLGNLNWFRISRLRRPSIGVSTVRKTALYPAFFARCISFRECSRSSNR